MNRTERLYAMAEDLRAAGSRGVSGPELARRFEVSTRTVKRDVSALQQAGVPVWAQPGRRGGYVLDAVATLPPINVTAAEATAIALALGALPSMPFSPDGRAALQKVLSVMPSSEQAKARALGRRLWFRDESPAARPRVARVLDEALREEVLVLLDYVDARGTRTLRRPVEPMALARTHGHWHLLGWDRSRDGGRWFRLDRVVGAVLTREPVPQRSVRAVFGAPPIDARPVRLS